jgi:hypothetical protein
MLFLPTLWFCITIILCKRAHKGQEKRGKSRRFFSDAASEGVCDAIELSTFQTSTSTMRKQRDGKTRRWTSYEMTPQRTPFANVLNCWCHSFVFEDRAKCGLLLKVKRDCRSATLHISVLHLSTRPSTTGKRLDWMLTLHLWVACFWGRISMSCVDSLLGELAAARTCRKWRPPLNMQQSIDPFALVFVITTVSSFSFVSSL